MHALDAHAYASPWRDRHPGEKALLAFGLLGCAVALPPWPGGPVVAAVALVLLLGPAGLVPAQVWRAVRVPLVFVAVGSLPLLVAVGTGDGGPLLRYEPTGPALAAQLAARATAALLCLILFAATTPLSDALPRLHRLGVPAAVTEIAALIYRLLFLLLDSASAVREAQAGRCGFRTRSSTFRSVAGQGGAIFTRAHARARAWEEGLALRGYDGSLRVQVREQPLSRPFLAATAALLAAVVVATLVLRGVLR